MIVDATQEHRINFDGVHASIACRFEAVDHIVMAIAQSDLLVNPWFEGIEAHVEAVESGFGE